MIPKLSYLFFKIIFLIAKKLCKELSKAIGCFKYVSIVVFFNECKFFKTLFNTRCLPSVDSCNLSVSFVIYSGTHITFYRAIIIFIIKTMIIA